MFQIFALIAPILKKCTYLAVLLAVFLIAYFVTWRWRQTFTPQWTYIGITMGIATLIVLIVVFVKWRHGKSMAKGLEAGITAADVDKVDLKGEIKALRDNWNESLARLKESAGAKSATATLYTLPWYIIIGEPASGKSTLLRKSGLDFPVGDAAISGMHGTRNCDWWFANEAIFLDTAGRYIIETQEAEWVTFLGLLKKYRTKRPINGVLVAVAANSLLTKSHEELLDDAKRIRARLDELIDELGINFPTYILVTKCDLISGFVEFFGPLDGRDRDQMIGWTNPPDPSAQFDAGEFDTRFGEVTSGLYRMRPWVESQGSRRGLMRAFLFPEEFSYLQQPLRTVLDSAFKPNVYQETPVCRGVYFSSGTQVGSPLAMALEDMAKDLNVTGLEELGLGMGVEEEKEVRTYFIKDFVSGQVLKDRDMNWRTQAAEKRLKKRRMGWGMIGVAAAAILALFGTSSFLANQGRLTDFRSHLPEAGRPLEVAVGCMKAHDEAVPPGVLDIGLNYSDDLMPSFRKTFHDLFTVGILDPLVDSLAGSAGRKLPEQSPDIESYARTYSHYLYLRDGLAGKLPEKFAKSTEQEHLDALFEILRDEEAVGKGTPLDLRNAIRRYGETAGLEGLAEHRRRDVEQKFARTIAGFVDRVDTWVAAAEERGEGLAGSHEDAVKGLITAAKTQRTHETKDAVDALARAIQGAARRQDGPKEQPVSTLAAGISEVGQLRSHVLELKQALAPEDPTIRKIDDLGRRLSVSATTPEMEAEDQARSALLTYLDTLIARVPDPVAYDPKPTRKWLETRQQEILDDLREIGEQTLEEIRPHVETLGGRIEAEGEDGKLESQPGWWDSFVFIAQAREADFRMEEYLEKGLIPMLADRRWKLDRNSDQDNQIYTVERIEQLILPRLRVQTKFFENDLVATEITSRAHDETTLAMTEFIRGRESDTGELEGGLLGYWLSRFDRSLPGGVPADLGEAGERVRSWNNPRSELTLTTKALRKALWDITRLQGPEEDEENDPVLRETQNARREVFDTFVVFFDADDDRVTPHVSVWDAKPVFGRLEKALGEGAAGFGGINQRGARNLVGRVMTGEEGAFAEAQRIVELFKRSSSTSRSAGLVAERMQALVTGTWTGLVSMTAKDVNVRWKKSRDAWVLDLEEDGTPANFERIFDRSRGQFGQFRKEILEPFFEFTPTGIERRPSPGKYLELDSRFESFLRTIDTIRSNVFEKGGGFRTERIECELGLAGDASPVSLKIEYVSKDRGTIPSGEFRNSEANKDFTFEWSPEDCLSFKFIIEFPEKKRREILFEGDWAVAEALTQATREESTWIWKRTDEEIGSYEVHLKIRGPAPKLAGVFRKFGGESPVKAVVSRMKDLDTIVTVEPR